jgi:hypothetical protein
MGVVVRRGRFPQDMGASKRVRIGFLEGLALVESRAMHQVWRDELTQVGNKVLLTVKTVIREQFLCSITTVEMNNKALPRQRNYL